MQDELEQSERDFKRRKEAEAKEKYVTRQEEERIKDQGRELREKKMQEAAERESRSQPSTATPADSATKPIELGGHFFRMGSRWKLIYPATL
jgi:hypothetical protein